jgi:hypothetical protein
MSDDLETRCFSYGMKYDAYEQGVLLSNIIDRLESRLEELSNVKALIKFKFNTGTRSLFLGL